MPRFDKQCILHERTDRSMILETRAHALLTAVHNMCTQQARRQCHPTLMTQKQRNCMHEPQLRRCGMLLHITCRAARKCAHSMHRPKSSNIDANMHKVIRNDASVYKFI